MPHIIVEHTQDVENVADLCSKLHRSLMAQEEVPANRVKTRSILVQNFLVGDSDNGSMLHITLKLLPGRSDDLIRKMTADLKNVIQVNSAKETSVTVEAVILHQESYQK